MKTHSKEKKMSKAVKQGIYKRCKFFVYEGEGPDDGIADGCGEG